MERFLKNNWWLNTVSSSPDRVDEKYRRRRARTYWTNIFSDKFETRNITKRFGTGAALYLLDLKRYFFDVETCKGRENGIRRTDVVYTTANETERNEKKKKPKSEQVEFDSWRDSTPNRCWREKNGRLFCSTKRIQSVPDPFDTTPLLLFDSLFFVYLFFKCILRSRMTNTNCIILCNTNV